MIIMIDHNDYHETILIITNIVNINLVRMKYHYDEYDDQYDDEYDYE